MKKEKQEFIKKWSSWWRLRPQYEEMNIAFESELNDLLQKQKEEFKALYIAASQILHLHRCEQEGIGGGMPTARQWYEAVNKLAEAMK